ncbi:MAG: hypothetical protein V1831_00220 [Candidatus Woesearchaeota archaeon]
MEKKMSLSLYQCALCTLKFKFDKIKYSKDGKKLICIDCHNKIIKKDQKVQVNENKQNLETKQRTSQPREGGIKVICVKCNYNFSYRPNLKLICPYCGGNKIKKYDEFSADKLIKDSSKEY